jgi:hypothetical protein
VPQGENAIYEGHGVKNEGETSAAIRAQMAADRAPLYHDNGDLQVDSVSILFSSGGAHAKNVQLNQRPLT